MEQPASSLLRTFPAMTHACSLGGALQSYFHKLCPDVIVHIGFGDVCLILHPCTGLMYGPVPGRGLISLIKPNTYVIVEGFGGVAAVDWG